MKTFLIHSLLQDKTILFLPPPPRIQTLQRIRALARHNPALAPLLINLPRLANPIRAVLANSHMSHVLLQHSRTTTRQQVIRNVLEMRLLAHGVALGVVAQVSQVLGVLLEMALQFRRVDEFLAEFLGTCLADGDAGDAADGVGDTVAESFELGRIELPLVDGGAEFGLAGLDALEDFLVVFALFDGGRFVLLILVFGDVKGEGHTLLTGAGGTACAVGVGFGGLGEVEVEDAGDVAEVDSTGDAEFAVAAARVLLLLAGWLLCVLAVVFVVVVFLVAAGLCVFRIFGLFRLLALALLLLAAYNFVLVCCDDDVVDSAVEFVDGVQSAVYWELRVEHTASDAELFQEELQSVATVDVGDENDDLALDELQLEDGVCEEEFVLFGGLDDVLR